MPQYLEHGLAVLKKMSHPNDPGCKPGRMLSDAINNVKIRCQEKLFDHRGIDRVHYQNFDIL
jgi:hypothetical protein